MNQTSDNPQDNLSYNPLGPALFWLWLPLSAFLFFTACEIWMPREYYAYFVGENGPIEFTHVIVTAVGCLIAIAGVQTAIKLKDRLLILWFGLAATGCFYIAGEEISWGQHLFQWTTPESWKAVNDQAETNLHNTTSWLDQKPRLLLEIGVIIGGLILPKLYKAKPGLLPAWFARLVPKARMATIALCFLVIKIFDKIGDSTDFVFYKRASEMTEFYVYYFLALYLWYLWQDYRPKNTV